MHPGSLEFPGLIPVSPQRDAPRGALSTFPLQFFFMFMGLGLGELVLALFIAALPLMGAAWVLGRTMRGPDRQRVLGASAEAELRAELAATQERLSELELKLDRTEERLEFAEQLRIKPESRL